MFIHTLFQQMHDAVFFKQPYCSRIIEEETVVVTQINPRKRTLTLSSLPGPGKNRAGNKANHP